MFFKKFQIIFQLLGMCPTKITSYNVESTQTYLLSISSLTQIVILSLLCVVTSWNQRNFAKESPVNEITSVLKEILVFGVHFTILVHSLACRYHFFKFWNEIENLRDFTFKNNFDPVKQINWKIKSLFFIYLLLPITLNTVVAHSFRHDPDLFYHWLCMFVSMLISAFRHLQFVVYLETIHIFLGMVTDEMKKVVEKCQYNRVVHEGAMTDNEELTHKMYQIRKVYQRLWYCHRIVNKIFGFSFMVNISYMFIETICDLYWIYVSIYNNTFMYIDDLLISIMTSIFYPYLSIKSANKCLEKNKELKFMVNNVKRETSQALNTELNTMALKMFQPTTFTADGYFDIDFTLMLEILAGLLTHLIIIIQFMPATNTGDSGAQWNQWGGKKEEKL
uniref:Gustatory receptor n=1 Tax=Culicoides sonorensis TaxID=179676 RepID=A0A336MWS3_CULSO